jgi:uncharacterized protein
MSLKPLVVAFLLFLSTDMLSAQRTSTFPAPQGFINDYEGIFTPEQVKSLDYAVKDLLAKAMEHDSLKGIELAVVTVTANMYGDEKEMSSYATRLGDKWGVGAKGENKAIIIAYSKSVRKVSIVTGSALDNFLTPAVCRNIIDEKMAPEFRKGNYYQAILTAIQSIKESLGLL